MHDVWIIKNLVIMLPDKKYNELRAYSMNLININKIVMSLIKYDKVVSRLSVFIQQNINAQTPLKFNGRLEVRTSKINASKLYRS